MWTHAFTVFTPTFNRRQLLGEVFESLLAQTFRDFEWLIVDDGSTDGTAELVQSWKQRSCFPIRYFYQANAGKHVAFNRGVQEARGELFLTLDSDDTCLPIALERFRYYWETIPSERRGEFSAVTALCLDERGEIIGEKFPQDILDSNSLETRYRYKVQGEKWGFQRTDVLRRFPFPVAAGVSFVPEGVVWGAIARQYKTRYVNEGLRVYRTTNQVGAQQLTRSPITPEKAAGMVWWYADVLNDEIVWFPYDPLFFLRGAVHFARFSLHTDGQTKGMRPLVVRWPAKILVWLAWPIGWMVYCLDQRRLHVSHA